MSRLDLTFESGGLRCAAWLYLPEAGGPSACVVMAHGFAGTRRDSIARYGERFAEHGLAALVFDFRHFGDSEGEPRQLLDIGLQHEDYAAAVAFARSRPEVDAARIALWGTSFSAAHVIHVAARDPSIAAAIAQTPMVDGRVQVMRFPPAGLVKVTVRGIADLLAGLRGAPPVTIRVIGPPGAAAALSSPSSEPGYRTILGEDSRWRDEIAARIMLRVGLYRPIRDAARVACPLLVCVGDRDDLTPPEPAARVAELAPRGELKRYPLDHWSAYTGAGFDSVAADEVEFLTRHLGNGSV